MRKDEEMVIQDRAKGISFQNTKYGMAKKRIRKLWSSAFVYRGDTMKFRLSEYADKNFDEMVAEAFAEYYCSDNPRDFCKKIVEEMKKEYEALNKA